MTSNPLVSRAIFGAADGSTSAVGVVAGLVVAHAGSTAILGAAVGGAVAAMVGMASGDWLGGASRLQAVVIGVATLAGSVLPAVPVVIVPGLLGYLTSGLLMLVLAVAISEARYESDRDESGGSRLRAYTTTLTILLVASGLSIAAALAVGAS